MDNLADAIQTYHGGFPHFRKLLGQDITVKPEKKLNKTYHQTRKPKKELSKAENLALADAIKRYHGDLTTFRKLLSEQQ